MAKYSVVNRKLVPKLMEITNLVLEREKSGSKSIHDAYTFDKSRKPQVLGKRCVSLINECLLNHHFEDAAKLLWIMCQDRSCFDLVLYKGIMIVLENLMPKNSYTDEIIEKLSNAAKGLQSSNRMDVQLDYIMYAFKNNIQGLENSSKFSDKLGRGRHRPIPLLQQLYSAYCALVNYKIWVNVSQGDSFCSNDKDFAFTVINSFKKLIDQPGIWDIFVLKLIEMLEYYEEIEELEGILKKYVECNPEHINAYIYLCVHLHKHKTDSKEFIDYAKVLANLCPSDERVLLLVQAWKRLGKKFKKRLKILFYFLDYPTNRRHILGWEMLSSHLYDAASGKESSSVDIVKSFWNLRCHSWNYIHFVSSNINSEDENFQLLLHKVKVITLFDPSHEYIHKAELRFPEISELKSTNEITESNCEDFKSLYHLER